MGFDRDSPAFDWIGAPPGVPGRSVTGDDGGTTMAGPVCQELTPQSISLEESPFPIG